MYFDVLDGLDKLIDAKKLKRFSLGEEYDSVNDADNIAFLAKGESKKEILEHYDIKDISELSDEDTKLFNLMFTRGRAFGRGEAVEAFMTSIGEAKPNQSALSYLKKFGEEWKETEDGDSNRELEGVKFTVNEKLI